MANSETIKEFLVSFGFKVEEAQAKKAQTIIADATKAVFALGAAIEATALTVAVGVAQFAANLDQLYFASQRTNSSVLNLKALGLAAKNAGSSADEAQSAVESLAAFIRNNPGGEDWLGSKGIVTRDANGNLRDTVSILLDLGKVFQDMSSASANQNAQFLGIPDHIMLALRSGELQKQLESFRAKLKDSGLDEAAKQARDFDEALDLLRARFEAIQVRLESGLLKSLQPELDKFGTWLDAHSDQIAKLAGMMAEDIVTAGGVIIPILSKIAAGWKDIYDIMKLTGDYIANHLPDSMQNSIGATMGSTLDALGMRTEVNKMLGLGSATNLPHVAGDSAWDQAWTLASMLNISSLLGAMINSKTNRELGGDMSSSTGSALAWLKPGAGFKQAMLHLASFGSPPQEQVMQFLQQHGRSAAEAAGIAANLQTESNFDPSAVGDHGAAYGIAQWHKEGQEAFKQWAGVDIRGSSRYQQLQFLEYDLAHRERMADNLLRNSRSEYDAGRNFSLGYERPAGGEAEADRRGKAAVSISQQTTIHVSGTDANATGRSVADQQARVNADLTRNVATAVH